MRIFSLFLIFKTTLCISIGPVYSQDFDFDLQTDLRETVPDNLATIQAPTVKRKTIVKSVPQPDKKVIEKIVIDPGDDGVALFTDSPNQKKKKTVITRVKYIPQPDKKIKTQGDAEIQFTGTVSVKEIYDSNIFNTNLNRKSEFFSVVTPQLALVVPLDKKGKNNFIAKTGLSFVRHGELKNRDSNRLISSAGLAHILDSNLPGRMTFKYGLVNYISYADNFQTHNSSSFEPSVGFSHSGIPTTNEKCDVKGKQKVCSTIGYDLNVSRFYVHNFDGQDTTSVSGSLSYRSYLHDKIKFLPGILTLGLSAKLIGAFYDDFEVTDRDDLSLSLSAGLKWLPHDKFEISTSIGFSMRESTFDPVDYDQLGLNGGISIKVLFN